MKIIFVTCALPYSNGDLHLGHLFEHIMADIWVKYHKMEGKTVYFICSDDSHGTAIMLKSQEKKICPLKIINKFYINHVNDFKEFSIVHDFYNITHSIINLNFVKQLFFILKEQNIISKKKIFQFYDKKFNFFLPDRFILGNCPKCNSPNQYGDNCESCGAVYNSCDIISPISKLSNVKPILKITENYFLKINSFKHKILNWINRDIVIDSIKHKVYEWLNNVNYNWCISRDYPYFGFNIPNNCNKYFYVWFDALVGYISTIKYFCRNLKKKYNKELISFKNLCNKNSNIEFYQFIGKDIIYFHTIIFPIILESLNFKKPNKIFIHGHLKINGKKMSKSKKNFIKAKNWIKNLDSDILRYYFASKISFENINDINLNKYDLLNKINSDLINKIINLASRTANIIQIYYKNNLSTKLINKNLYDIFIKKTNIIRSYAREGKFKLLIIEVIKLAKKSNESYDQYKPWLIIKYISDNENKQYLHSICTLFINIFRILMTSLKPILPKLSKKVEYFLNDNLSWTNIKKPLLNHKIKKFNIMLNRITYEDFKNLI